jgi:hypothetical protein
VWWRLRLKLLVRDALFILHTGRQKCAVTDCFAIGEGYAYTNDNVRVLLCPVHLDEAILEWHFRLMPG